MIVVDTSALTAIYRREEDDVLYKNLISRSDELRLPIHVYVEFSRLRRYGQPRVWLDLAIKRYRFLLTALEPAMAYVAADASDRFGKGTGHPARLNFGDCLSYAVARHLGAPLLYKGAGFIHTDIESALPA
jgi:ribonuclease VapC